MKTHLSKRNHAITLIEVLVIVAVLMLLAVLLLTWQSRAMARSIRINCIFDLKSIGLAFNVWKSDHLDRFPMEVSQTNEGTMELTSGPNAFRHFQVMSNELSTSIVVTCPSERIEGSVNSATNWINFNNSNISFFVGVDAAPFNASAILAGDRNITNGTALKNDVLDLTTNQASGWTTKMHNKVGNVLLADSSVKQVDTRGLRELVADTGLATNRLQMP